MNILSEYDLRQIKLMDKIINLFENNKIDLFELVNNLNGLLNALESIDDSWKDDFQAAINSLDIIQVCIQDGSIARWKGNLNEDIHKLISVLKKMTTSLSDEYLNISDPSILESAIEVDPNYLICPKCNEVWEDNSLNAMVICPKCDSAYHNPRVSYK